MVGGSLPIQTMLECIEFAMSLIKVLSLYFHYDWVTRNYGSKQPILRMQPKGEVCLRRLYGGYLQCLSNLTEPSSSLYSCLQLM